MTKKKKTRINKQSKVAVNKPSHFEKTINWKWFPLLLFGVLSLIYFAGFITSDVIIEGTDISPRGSFSQKPAHELLSLIQPANWSENLGGTAASDKRVGGNYFPLDFLEYFMPKYKALGWQYIIIVFCAGFFMFLYLSSLKIRRTFALLIGVGYMFAPTFLTFTYAGHDAKMQVIAFLPLLFLAIERGMETKKFIYFALLAGVIVLDIFTNHLQMAYFSLWGVGFYILFKLWQTFRREKELKGLVKRLIFVVVGIALGLSIGSVNLFPPYFHATTVSKRAAQTNPEYATSWSLHPEEMGSLIVPEFSGYLRTYWGRNPFKLNSEYMGIIILAIAFFGLLTAGREPRFWFFIFLFGFSAAYSLGEHTPIHKLFYMYVPGVKSLRTPGMIAFLFLFSTCAMAGLSLEKLSSMRQRGKSRIVLGAGIIGVIIALTFISSLDSFFEFWTNNFYSEISPEKIQVMRNNFSNVKEGMGFFCLFWAISSALIYLRVNRKLRDSHLFVILLPLILIDTWRIDKKFLNYTDADSWRRRLKPENKLASFLREDNSRFRVLPYRLLRGNEGKFKLNGVNMVSYFSDFTNKRYYQMTRPENLNNLNIINLLNTKYIISKRRLEIPGMQEVYSNYGFFAYKNTDFYPWFYLADDYVVLKDRTEIIETLKSPEFNPRRTVILEEKPGIEMRPKEASQGSIKELEYNEKRGYVKLKVNTNQKSFLVFCENYHPNWSAYIDGEQKKIFRANYIWKGIFIPPGKHIVEFKYASKVALIFRWMSFLSFLAFIGTIAIIIKRKRT